MRDRVSRRFLFVPLSRTQAAVFSREPDHLWWHRRRNPPRNRRIPRRRFKRISAVLAFVGSNDADAVSAATNPVTYSPVAGNLVVVFVESRETTGLASTINAPTDNAAGGSSTYTQVFQQSNFDAANQFNAAVFYCASVKAGVTTITANLSASTVNSLTIVAEYSGGAASPLDQFTSTATSAAGTAAVSGPVTTLQNAEVVIGFFSQKTNSTFTYSASAPYNLRISGTEVNNGVVSCLVDQIVATKGTYSAQVNISSSATYWAWAVTFTAPVATVEQSKYRFHNDDGNEHTATFAANENTTMTAAKNANRRLRVQLNATNDPTSQSYQIEYRKQGSTVWHKVGE